MRQQMVRSIMVAVAMCVAAAAQVAAQGAPTGRILGRIVDAETGRALPGAQVSIEGTRVGSLAGIDGRYILVNVPSGERTVVVNFIGYAPKSVTGVRVPEGSAVSLDITLNSAAVAIEGITVSAERERGSVSRALDAQRTASGVTSAITAEQIARSPDSDAAAAVQRVSGVTVQDGKYVFVRGLGERYTTTSLNGARIPSPEPERKTVPLDLFPTGLLQTITTSKTFTPNLSGDFSGAQVDIRTREFPNRAQLTFSASTGYNPEVTGRTVLAAPNGGREWLATAAAPRQIPAAASQMPREPARGPEVNRVVNSFRNAWSVRQENALPASSFGASLGGSEVFFGRNVGFLASLNYSSGSEVNMDQRRARAGAGGSESDRYDGETGRYSVLWGGLVNLSTMVGTHTRIALNNTYNRSADNEARRETGVDANTLSRVQVERLRYVERTVRSNQFVAEHQLNPRHRLDWSVTSSGVVRQEPDRSEFVTQLDFDTPIWFKDFEGAVRTFSALDEGSLEGAVNYRVEFGSGTAAHRLQFGGLARQTQRGVETRGFRIQPFFWSPTDPRWQAPPEQFFDGRYATDADANFSIARDGAGGTYEARDRVFAGYAMAEIALSPRMKLVGGARLEQSTLTLDYEAALGERGQVEPSYTDLLPSLALNLDLTGRQKLRFSAARTLARPEYREVAPVNYREVLGGEQVIGNSELRRTLIDNLDARWEWYPSPTQLLSVGVFGKRFQDPIEQRYLATSGTDVRTFRNSESAVNFGVELEVIKGLGDLAATLAPLSVFGNLTLIRSEVSTGEPDDPRRAMVGQAPYVVNTGLTYAPGTGRTSATLLYNVVGERIVNARSSGQLVDNVVEMPRQMLDMSLRLPLFGDVAGKIDLKNLLDAPYEIRQGEVTREFYRSGRSVSVGASWRR